MTAARVTSVADAVHVALARIDDLPSPPPGTGAADRERLAARTLLRYLLGDVVGPDAAGQPVRHAARGRPYLPGRPDLAVSLSHSEGYVAAAVHTGGGAVGIDVQFPVPVRERLLDRFAAPVRRGLAALPPARRPVALAQVWAVQEACVKATGAGLSGLPWTIPVEPGRPSGTWRGLRWATLPGPWRVPAAYAYEE